MNMIFSQEGEIALEQYLNVYDYCPTLQCIFYNEEDTYKFELWFWDKVEPVFCNVKLVTKLSK